MARRLPVSPCDPLKLAPGCSNFSQPDGVARHPNQPRGRSPDATPSRCPRHRRWLHRCTDRTLHIGGRIRRKPPYPHLLNLGIIRSSCAVLWSSGSHWIRSFYGSRDTDTQYWTKHGVRGPYRCQQARLLIDTRTAVSRHRMVRVRWGPSGQFSFMSNSPRIRGCKEHIAGAIACTARVFRRQKL
jgi:hypothetical protein